mmetsp:Transcript_18776/g.54051  ORF Transcript_18776/g.54051 Transcript_18776/m.54051 type:complete len:288 (-) Transcript_18776:1177-2040(-)
MVREVWSTVVSRRLRARCFCSRSLAAAASALFFSASRKSRREHISSILCIRVWHSRSANCLSFFNVPISREWARIRVFRSLTMRSWSLSDSPINCSYWRIRSSNSSLHSLACSSAFCSSRHLMAVEELSRRTLLARRSASAFCCSSLATSLSRDVLVSERLSSDFAISVLLDPATLLSSLRWFSRAEIRERYELLSRRIRIMLATASSRSKWSLDSLDCSIRISLSLEVRNRVCSLTVVRSSSTSSELVPDPVEASASALTCPSCLVTDDNSEVNASTVFCKVSICD